MRFLDLLVKASRFLEVGLELTKVGLVLAKTINAIIKMVHMIITGHIQTATCFFCSFGCSTLVSFAAVAKLDTGLESPGTGSSGLTCQ
jgi:hypothetical protein